MLEPGNLGALRSFLLMYCKFLLGAVGRRSANLYRLSVIGKIVLVLYCCYPYNLSPSIILLLSSTKVLNSLKYLSSFGNLPSEK